MDFVGMDGAIAYSSAARIFQAFSGVISIFFIATFLTAEEQGYYYTFGSILAIQVFFELGFTGIMTQYVAHEVAHLKIGVNWKYQGERKYVSRLAFLIRFCIKWYVVIAVIFFVIILILGYIFFSKYSKTDANISWFLPWLLLAFSTSIKLFQSPFSAIYMGLGKVKEMNKIAFYQQLVIPISQWVLFACGLKLYVVGIGSLLAVIMWIAFIIYSPLKNVMINLLQEKVTEKVSYHKEIFPYQWKIALSWISGFFIFQLFNPVLFAKEGAVVAGQMGMTIQVLNAIQAFSLSWQNTKVPLYSGLIESKDYNTLDRIFNISMKQMLGVCCFLLFGLFCAMVVLRETHFTIGHTVVGDRFLDYLPMFIMMAAMFINVLVSSWAIYLRCHKQEPYLITSVISGIFQCLSVYFLGNTFGLYGLILGYLGIFVLILPMNYIIFKNKKSEWHIACIEQE